MVEYSLNFFSWQRTACGMIPGLEWAVPVGSGQNDGGVGLVASGFAVWQDTGEMGPVCAGFPVQKK